MEKNSLCFTWNGWFSKPDVFEIFAEKSTQQYGINPLYSYSAPGYTWKTDLKITSIKLDSLHFKGLLLLFANTIRGWNSAVTDDRYVELDEKQKFFNIVANCFTDGQ